MEFKKLRERRDALYQTASNIIAKAGSESRNMTAEEFRDWSGVMAKLEEAQKTMTCAHDVRRMSEVIDAGNDVRSALQQRSEGMVYVPRDSKPGEVRAFKPNEAIAESRYSGAGLGSYVRGIVTGKWDGAEELRSLAEGSTPGSYLVPTPLATYIIDKVRNQAQVLRAGAMTVPMESATLKIARLNTDVTSAWKAENAAMTFSDANFDVVTFTANTLMAGSKLSIEVVEDAFNIDAIVSDSITKSLALAVDYAALYGSGSSNQPTGIKNQSGVTLTNLGTNGFTMTDFSKYSTGISALMGNNFNGPFGILHSARTAGELDNLQDTLHQPLRQPDLVASAAKFVTNQIPNNLTVGTGTTCSDAFIGQWDQCMLGIRTGLVMEISRVAADSNSSAFTNGQVWIRAYLRADVQLAHPLAFNVLSGIL